MSGFVTDTTDALIELLSHTVSAPKRYLRHFCRELSEDLRDFVMQVQNADPAMRIRWQSFLRAQTRLLLLKHIKRTSHEDVDGVTLIIDIIARIIIETIDAIH